MPLALKIGEEFWIKPNMGIEPKCAVWSGNQCVVWIGGKSAYASIGSFISAVLPNIYVIAGIILFISLLAGGIMVIAGAGKGESESTKKGQQAISAALIGFLIIFASYWIIQIIEIVSGIQIFKSGI